MKIHVIDDEIIAEVLSKAGPGLDVALSMKERVNEFVELNRKQLYQQSLPQCIPLPSVGGIPFVLDLPEKLANDFMGICARHSLGSEDILRGFMRRIFELLKELDAECIPSLASNRVYLDVDPGDLLLPAGRLDGADPGKYSYQILEYDTRIDWSSPITVYSIRGGGFLISNGVTRACRSFWHCKVPYITVELLPGRPFTLGSPRITIRSKQSPPVT